MLSLLLFQIFFVSAKSLCPAGSIQAYEKLPSGKTITKCVAKQTPKVVASPSAPSVKTSPDVQKAKEIFSQLLAGLVPGKATAPKSGEFTTCKCNVDKSQWGLMIFMNQSVNAQYRFASECDIEGNVSPKVMTPFPVVMKLRKLGEFDKVDMTMFLKVTLTQELGALMEFTCQKGLLSSPKQKMSFVGNYKIEINAQGEVAKNYGGTFQALALNGKKINFSSPIHIDFEK